MALKQWIGPKLAGPGNKPRRPASPAARLTPAAWAVARRESEIIALLRQQEPGAVIALYDDFRFSLHRGERLIAMKDGESFSPRDLIAAHDDFEKPISL